MKSLKILGISGALVAAAVIGGTLIGAVSAHPAGPSGATGATGAVTTTSDPGEYCQAFLDAFAADLGVDVADLTPAAKAAAKTAVDKAVADGDLTQAMADQIKQRIDSATGDGCGWLGRGLHGALRNAVRGGIGLDVVSAAADALNLQPAELRTRLADGDSLKQIAADQKVDYGTVTAAIHDAVKADLDKLVAAGKLTAERETQLLDNLDTALADGKLFNGNGPFGPGHGHGRGLMAPMSGGASGAS